MMINALGTTVKTIYYGIRQTLKTIMAIGTCINMFIMIGLEIMALRKLNKHKRS